MQPTRHVRQGLLLERNFGRAGCDHGCRASFAGFVSGTISEPRLALHLCVVVNVKALHPGPRRH
jgi:hypothetical protein